MSLALLVVTAVRIEGRTKAEVARDYGLSRQWVHELVRRFDDEGESGLEPRSRRPRSSPMRTPTALEDEIVELRKGLLDDGLDAGAHTIAFHLTRSHGAAPSAAAIWRILSRRGFVTPQPQKRPKNSYVRFEAEMPNERWQADITHWRLSGGTEVEILMRHSRPYHPQTCGKVERFHQTLKRWLARQAKAKTLEELQEELDRFRDHYNTCRPHRALGRRTPAEAFAARPKAAPGRGPIPANFRVRRDRIDTGGAVTLRHDSRLHHIKVGRKVGRRHAGTRVLMLVAGSMSGS